MRSASRKKRSTWKAAMMRRVIGSASRASATRNCASCPVCLFNFRKLVVEMFQGSPQDFPIPWVVGAFQIVNNTSTGHQQAFALFVTFRILRAYGHTASGTPRLGGFNLRLDRFAFPTSSHALSLARRTGGLLAGPPGAW